MSPPFSASTADDCRVVKMFGGMDLRKNFEMKVFLSLESAILLPIICVDYKYRERYNTKDIPIGGTCGKGYTKNSINVSL